MGQRRIANTLFLYYYIHFSLQNLFFIANYTYSPEFVLYMIHERDLLYQDLVWTFKAISLCPPAPPAYPNNINFSYYNTGRSLNGQSAHFTPAVLGDSNYPRHSLAP